MNLAISFLVFAACLVVLAKVADVLVNAVTVLAAKWRLSGAVAGATLAATATSAPELGTTIAALAQGDAATADVGVGTVIGSAVFNLVAVVGVVALAGRITISRGVLTRDLLAYALAVAALLVCVLLVGEREMSLSRPEAVALLAGYGLYVLWIVRHIRQRRSERGHEPSTAEGSLKKALGKLVVGVLIVGAACHFLVDSVRTIVLWSGDLLGLPPAAVASVASVVVIAAVTSVPDAFTSLAAARRGEGSLAVSNAIGSNTFDILICLGLPYATLGGEAIARPIVWAMGYLLGTVALVYLFLRKLELRRWHGVVLVASYVLFVALVIGVSLWRAR